MKKTTKTAKRTAGKSTRRNGAAKTTRKGNQRDTKSNERYNPMGYLTEDVDDEGALNELFIDLLKDMYWAEKYLVKNLPDVEDAATTQDLKSAIREHWNVTKSQVQKLEQVFESIGEEPASKKCPAMKGLVEEVTEVIGETDSETLTRDAALIISAQKVEHYEIASYGGLAALAKVLGHREAGKILAQILSEEKEADEKLTAIAEKQNVNMAAAQEA